jgi:hypothetical protein
MITAAEFAKWLAAFNISPGGGSNTPGEAGFSIINSGVDVNLTNPLKAFYAVTTTAPGVKIKLPAMNLGNSLAAGEGVNFSNDGAEEFELINFNDVTVALIPPGALVRITRKNDATVAGTFQITRLGSIAQQQADSVDIKGDVELNGNASTDLQAIPLQQLTTGLNTKQPINAVLSQLSLLDVEPLGLMVQTAELIFVKRVLQSLSDAIVITDADGVAGNPKFNLDQSQIELTIEQIISLGDTLTALADELDTKMSLNGGNFLGPVELFADGATGLQPVTFQQFQAMVAGLKYKDSCRTATDGPLTATYNNGASGVGATLTFAGAVPAISGVTLGIGTDQRVNVKDQPDQTQNGIYFKSASNVLTRATDYDTPAEVVAGSFTNIVEGDLAGQFFFQQTTGAITIGTSPLVFGLLAVINAGPGTELTGPNTIGLPDLLLSAFASNDASKTFNISVNTRGMITAVTGIAIQIAKSQVTDLVADLATINSSISSINAVIAALGTMATQDANNVNITGGNAVLANLTTSATVTHNALTANKLVATNASKELISMDIEDVGGLVLIEAKQASNSPTVEFVVDSTVLATYKELILKYDQVRPTVNNVLLCMTLSNNGGSSFLNTGYKAGLWVREYNTAVISHSQQTTLIGVSGNYTSNANDSASGEVKFFGMNSVNPRIEGLANLISNNSTFREEMTATINTSGVNALRLFMGSGNISSGRFALYGIPI